MKVITVNGGGLDNLKITERPNPTPKAGEILVQFDSSNKSGNQSKRVTITANTNPAQTFLTIKGIVNKAEATQ